MGKPEGIRVFLRIRPYVKGLPRSLNGPSHYGRGDEPSQSYSIEHTFDNSTVHFHVDRRVEDDVVNNTQEDFQFTFRRAFEPTATQADVFNVVAKDCVMAALDGYNSTVFAYGQTGSGKTHSITGGAESYEDRGIIPRALALLYDEITRRQQHEATYSVAISYLQIYNDKGQDLLNRGKDARRLEDLPVVTIHDCGSDSDEVVLRGLAQHGAATPQDALNLLFLGDTNRLYCETPMNKTSSRSHCVFTIYLEARPHGASVVRHSKLHFVDLAGSERVAKTGVSGTVLTEAKHINLSLHYLEQVIMALSEQASGRREHVPFRNSFMTMVLRDSLGPNCRTSMLATAHPSPDQLPETISTCRFAQRVAMIKQAAQINEEVDPHLLVRKLKSEIQLLREQVAFFTKDGGGAPDRPLSDDEKLRCEEMIKRYVDDTSSAARIEGCDGDLARIYFCFAVLKRMVLSGVGGGGKTAVDDQINLDLQHEIESSRARIEALETSLKQKENEMNMLFDVLQRTHRARYNAETQTGAVRDGGRPVSVDKSDVGVHGCCNRTAVSVESSVPSLGVLESPDGGRGAQLVCGGDRHKDVGGCTTPALRAACERLAPAEATAVDEFFQKQKHLNETYDLSALTDAELLKDRAIAFEAFSRSYRQCAQVEASKKELKSRYEACKDTARQLNEVVDRIRQLKSAIQRLRAERVLQGVEEVDETERRSLEELTANKTAYNELATSLKQQKESIDAMHLFMKRAQEQLTRDFEDWFNIRQKQLNRAAGSVGGDGECAIGTGLRRLATDAKAITQVGSFANTFSGTETHANCLSASPERQGVRLTSSGIIRSPLRPHSHLQYPSEYKTPYATKAPLTGLPPLREELMTARHAWSATAPVGVVGSARGNNAGHPTNNGMTFHPDMAVGQQNCVTGVPSLISVDQNRQHPLALSSGVNGLLTNQLPSGNCIGMQSSGCVHLADRWKSGATTGHGNNDIARNNNNNGSGSTDAPNPYAPDHRSTGDVAADKQLAALYKAREALRQQLDS
ncbi:Microtubule binding Kinesin motor domain [Trypanosoma vivax]|nr:kinesin [Trypanosoma vivax]KAH8616962.1 Microtubule binding Kinesin motor domain [Trypanosoma vivax]